MEKRTILAVVLSMAVMMGFFFLQNLLFPPPAPLPQSSGQAAAGAAEAQGTQAQGTAIPEGAPSGLPLEEVRGAAEEVPPQTVTVETDLVKAVFTNSGGNLVSYQLKEHLDKGEPVEMIFSGGTGNGAFALAFGGREELIAGSVKPVERNFRVRRVSDLIVEFSQDFTTVQGAYFTLTKRYEFKPGEYMFELIVALNGGNSVSSYDFRGAAYTLFFGPQIGPKFEKLDQRYEYRRYLSYKAKLRNEKVGEREPTVITDQPSWTAIAGKYFTLIALPYTGNYELAFSAQPESGVPAASKLYITRPASSGSRIEDKYQFYLGPKNQENLNIYDRGDNAYKLQNTGIIEVANTKGFLAPLETALKWLLMFFYRIIPNYGVAIILLTLLVKAALFPLTKKSSESTLRMQALSPRIKEIQDKYKDNPQKMNLEMAEFYKKEGYNPLSGCLPMLIQFPIFFAMYNLFNNHFDLRGAMFIPGWIPDLSLPEAIYTFPDGFALPLLGWTAIRLLPFIYVGSQLLYGKVTQTPDQQGNAQMKIMLYAMPVIFFFVLYDVPSGLLVYWILSNILTLVQQLAINKYIAGKKAAMSAAADTKPVIAPSGPRKRKRK